MAYKIKTKKKGRPRVNYKVRDVKGITPVGFEFDRIDGEKIIYRRKKSK
jgi:hypothetical protein